MIEITSPHSLPFCFSRYLGFSTRRQEEGVEGNELQSSPCLIAKDARREVEQPPFPAPVSSVEFKKMLRRSLLWVSGSQPRLQWEGPLGVPAPFPEGQTEAQVVKGVQSDRPASTRAGAELGFSKLYSQPVLPPVPAERGVSGQAKQEQRGQGCGEVQPLSLLAGCELGQLLRPET